MDGGSNDVEGNPIYTTNTTMESKKRYEERLASLLQILNQAEIIDSYDPDIINMIMITRRVIIHGCLRVLMEECLLN